MNRLGRSTQILAACIEQLLAWGIRGRVFNLGEEDIDTATPMDSMTFTIMEALAQARPSRSRFQGLREACFPRPTTVLI